MPHDSDADISVDLWPGTPPAQAAGETFTPWLDVYPLANGEQRPAVLICPGGGYGGRARHEGIDVARAFNAAGFPAFVCQYRVSPNRHPAPLYDVARAIRTIRARAAEWGVNPHAIAVCGFSAGGHLTASLGTLYRESTPPTPDAIDAQNARPDALILSYAVLAWGEFAHKGSFNNLLGPDADEDARAAMGLDSRVDEHTPPTFLWHTADDAGVPVENSLLFATALRRHRVPFAMHVAPHGRHGLGLAPDAPYVARWHELACHWLRDTFADVPTPPA